MQTGVRNDGQTIVRMEMLLIRQPVTLTKKRLATMSADVSRCANALLQMHGHLTQLKRRL